MKPPTIGLGMIVHPQDTHLLSPFLARHQASFDAVSIVLDAEVETVSASALIRSRFQAAPHRLRLAERVLGRDFATQRNFCASLNPCDWLLMLDMDERLHVRMLQLLKPVLAMVLSKTPETRVIGFARRNVIDGRATEVWPDWQYRLVKRGVRWRNSEPFVGARIGCHEFPREVHDAPETVVVLGKAVIIHEKTSTRQLEQNLFYESIA